MVFTYLFCPVQGCPYRTGADSPRDVAARNALIAHLQRKRHALTNREAKELGCAAPFGELTEAAAVGQDGN